MHVQFDIERFLPYRLNRLAETFSGNFARYCSQNYELSWSEWQVLWALGEEVHATAKAISNHSGLGKTKVSRAVKALDDRGWLERSTSEEDRRFEQLRLTSEGRRNYNELRQLAGHYQRWLETTLDLPYRNALDEGLLGMEDAIAGGLLTVPGTGVSR
ncbi:DNA-binding transcriptional regulator, MarR family [Rhizobium sp. RU36D]|nr:DNA-binding transcriptional regulator, MarR family [Rhizobium sp. RU36D]